MIMLFSGEFSSLITALNIRSLSTQWLSVLLLLLLLNGMMMLLVG